MSRCQIRVLTFFLTAFYLFQGATVSAYEVAVGLGSTAPPSATIALGDRSKWPVVAELSWGSLANLVPLATGLTEAQQTAVFNSFKHRRAITELTYPNVRFNESQPDIDFLNHFLLDIPFVFVLDESNQDSMLTKAQIKKLKTRFAGRTVIMNTRSWTRDNAWLAGVTDVLDAVCIEFMPHNTPAYIAKDVAPFAVWAHNHKKKLFLLMPPLPDDYLDDRFVQAVKQAAQAIYDANKNILPKGWMKSNNIIFVPANYTWTPPGSNRLRYVPEDSRNSVLAAAKALFMMRPQLDAGPVNPKPDLRVPQAIDFLLNKKKD